MSIVVTISTWLLIAAVVLGVILAAGLGEHYCGEKA